MSTDEYVPSEKAVRHAYVVIENRRDILAARAEFDRFLARVRRDAAREALLGFGVEWDGLDLDQPLQAAFEYADAHYPKETP